MDGIKKQIGCGYCAHETNCKIRVREINKAKLGCKDFLHWTKAKDNDTNGRH